MDDLFSRVAAKKKALDQLRPMSRASLDELQNYYDIELTYTSNAIEGNTLTLRETAEVIEHGITVGGKKLKEHLEAVDHYDALLWMRGIAGGTAPVDEDTVRELHRRVVARSEPDIAGVYSMHRRRIAGSHVVLPNPVKVPALMQEFGQGLETAQATPEAAFDAHFGLTAIHPFSDGNGRTARLLTNLLLIRCGYVPVAVRPEDRKPYLDALEHGSLTGDLKPFQAFMHERLDSTLEEYLSALKEALPAPKQPGLRS